ncbi:L,D-transpeptidase family protein [Streptomyces sp. NPDC051320]|uniref:L,D-transpeptidase family protein n=1 Tax=Streptomyces sp. NPDC051320 TaxID=3154644 RepID=UPI00344753DA
MSVSLPVPSRRGSLVAAALLSTGMLLSGCAGAPSPAADGAGRTAADDGSHAGRSAPRPLAARAEVPATPQEIPALGPHTRGQIPDSADQAVVVTGDGHDASRSTVVRYTRDPDRGWQQAGDPWSAHNALNGWSEHHRVGDLRSPEGVFGLTDAGGRRADPGTRLPYDRGPGFVAHGTGFKGESLAGAFDYVVAINYNRKPGTTPLDWTRPLGAGRGGGIWFHVDHGGPTHGCVSLSESRMKQLLRWLDPAKKPVVVMGDAATLRR